MRLYLSSYKLGDHAQELVRLAGTNKRTAVIMNAGDHATSEKRANSLNEQITWLGALGLQAEELDLRDYFGKAEKLEKDLSAFGVLWLRGGNCFILKRAMEQSGFDKIIGPMMEKDSFVYAGYSAGVCVAAPTLKGIELCDDEKALPQGYAPDFKWEGLNLIPYSIAPHYRSDHPESEMIEDVVKYLEQNKMPYRAMQDGDVIVIDGRDERWLKRKPPAAPQPKP